MPSESVETVVDEFVEHKESELDESWAGTCRRSAHLFIEFCEEKNLDPENHKFNKLNIEQYQTYLKNQTELANSTTENYCMAARELIRYANMAGYGWDAVFEKGKPRSIIEADIAASKTAYEEATGDEIPYVTEEEHQALLEEVSNPRDELILRIARCTLSKLAPTYRGVVTSV